MASTKTPAQIKANYVRLMGPQAGESFAELMQDAARLHLEWNEFLALFAVGPAQIDTLNKAAPGFFYLVSEAWWEGLTLYPFSRIKVRVAVDPNSGRFTINEVHHIMPTKKSVSLNKSINLQG